LQLPRTARLLRPADFAALKQHGKRFTTRHFVIEHRPNAAAARLGMAVSRRVSKKAVERNRIRRQIREQFRLNQPRLPHADVLVIARPSAAGRANADLRLDLDLVWHKLAALKEADAPGTMRADS
jgi:ribonuclease P protein component